MTRASFVDRFAAFCSAVVRVLPFGLNRIVAPTLLGFAIINGFTFAVDLALLTVFHGWLNWPVPVAVTTAYVLAFGLSFVLNRTFNFRSHAPVGRQAELYAVVVAINYAAFILGIGSGLAAVGVEYHVARLIAGACEAVFMYSAMRWVVFRVRSTAERG
ncbi:GtrA family protein [Nocardiaceae bacterium YC2-7]|uniref:GtrA family protein n=1 Tax=Antrihabitans stalactiti TaxID=2584121 RepID=A0A848K2L7_9NOCA|nr:GtrA family protein [Antrihabitans stalactiti]